MLNSYLLIYAYSIWNIAYVKICINREKKPVAIFDHKSGVNVVRMLSSVWEGKTGG
jgi:hypothetical protein